MFISDLGQLLSRSGVKLFLFTLVA